MEIHFFFLLLNTHEIFHVTLKGPANSFSKEESNKFFTLYSRIPCQVSRSSINAPSPLMVFHSLLAGPKCKQHCALKSLLLPSTEAALPVLLVFITYSFVVDGFFRGGGNTDQHKQKISQRYIFRISQL